MTHQKQLKKHINGWTVKLTICLSTKRKVSALNMKNMQVFETLCYLFLNNDLKVKKSQTSAQFVYLCNVHRASSSLAIYIYELISPGYLASVIKQMINTIIGL